MSSTSTGGNKKSSSKSDISYFARAKAGLFAETHKAKRIARHNKRMDKKRMKLIARSLRRPRFFADPAKESA